MFNAAFGQGNSLRAAQCIRLPAACLIGLGAQWKESGDTKSAGFNIVPNWKKPAYWFEVASSIVDIQQLCSGMVLSILAVQFLRIKSV